MLRKILVSSILTSLILWCIPGFAAQNYESITRLKEITKNYVVKNIALNPDESMNVEINQSDMQLKVAACTTEITPAFPVGTQKDHVNSVELSCNGEPSWHIYVPVIVEISTKVIVAKRAIFPHEIISENDIDYAPYRITQLYNGYFKSIEEVNGHTATQTIAAGAVLTRKNIQQPQYVHRNQVIDLFARSNTVTVSMKGIAQADGGLNDIIKAFNPSSKRIVDAIVVGPNKAEVIS